MMMRMMMMMMMMKIKIKIMIVILILMITVMVMVTVRMTMAMTAILRLQLWVEAGGWMSTHVRNNVLTMMLLPKQRNCERSLMPCSNQGCGLLTSFRGVDVLAACYAGTETPARIYKRGGREGKRGGKDIIPPVREGGKEGRQEERNKGPSPKCCVHLPIYTCSFQRAASPTQFMCAGFRMWRTQCSLLYGF